MHELFNYDQNTGKLFWKIRKSGILQNRGADREAGNFCNTHKCRKVMVNKKNYYVHRIVWFLHYGYWPTKQIDHINGIPSDNRICNLREASDAENKQNLGIKKTNTTGQTGVCLDKRYGTYSATIHNKGKKIHLGTFKTFEESKEAYIEAKKQIHKFNPVQRTCTNN